MSATTQPVGMKRALAFPEDEMPTPLAPAAGLQLTDPTIKVKERVKELETLLIKARAELQESEAEKYKMDTPEGSKAPSVADEIGADDMVKSPPKVEPPPGIAGEEEDDEECGHSSKGPDPMQEPQNDAWHKAKDEGNQPPAWVMDLILQQNATMKDLQEQIKELKGGQPQAPVASLVGANLAEKPIAPMDRKILDKPGK